MSSQVVIAVSGELVWLLGSAASFRWASPRRGFAALAAASLGYIAGTFLAKKADRRSALEAIDATVAVGADVSSADVYCAYVP